MQSRHIGLLNVIWTPKLVEIMEIQGKKLLKNVKTSWIFVLEFENGWSMNIIFKSLMGSSLDLFIMSVDTRPKYRYGIINL